MMEKEIAYAKDIANGLWENHYKEQSPFFEVSDDLMVILSQIDNMIVDLTLKDKGV